MSKRFLSPDAKLKQANIQIALITGTREQMINEELINVRVEIERVPIDRTVDVVPPIRQEGDITIIPVVEEIVVVERQLVLKEEVRVRRVSKNEQHQETVVLRQQEAVITRERAGQSVPIAYLLYQVEFKQYST